MSTTEHFPVRPTRDSVKNALSYWIDVGFMPYSWTRQLNRQLRIVARQHGLRSGVLYDQLRAEVTR
ncbi:MAG TPA: hypothetical protein VG276_25040 [Actinomycetes bacterium]|jgi:hypothetical protein|nr:hypothetical protein [Actinomycetes bacterium]